jgi:hypothetical protein
MAPTNLQQANPWPDILASYQAGMQPYNNAPIRQVPIVEEQQASPAQAPGIDIGGILKGLGMMGLKKKPGSGGGGVPQQMDAGDLFPQ